MSTLIPTTAIVWCVSFSICTYWMGQYNGGYQSVWRHLRSRGAGPLRAGVAVAAGSAVVFLVSPILLCICLPQGRRQARRYKQLCKKLQREHQELLLAPVDRDELPEEVLGEFDDLTPAIERCGYGSIGDFVMKENPPNYFGRMFQSEDGTTLCGLTWMFDELYYSFTTLLAGGRLVETCSNDPVDSLWWTAGHDRCRAEFTSWLPVEKAEDIHRALVAKFAAEVGEMPLAFESAAFRSVMEYEHRLFSQVQYERGEKESPPPTPQLPKGTPVPVSKLQT